MAEQPDLFPHTPRVETVDPEEVRAELIELLRIARSAHDVAPWDRRTHRYHQVVFPQMAWGRCLFPTGWCRRIAR